MDACAVSMANGLKHPYMRKILMLIICLTFGIFQGIMPLIGYFTGHAILTYLQSYIPWIALLVLGLLGLNMILNSCKQQTEVDTISIKGVFLQVIATSLDALTVGFSIANYTIFQAIQCVCIIAGVTSILCVLGFQIGKKFGTRFGPSAQIIGGLILIGIGIEIFMKGI